LQLYYYDQNKNKRHRRYDIKIGNTLIEYNSTAYHNTTQYPRNDRKPHDKNYHYHKTRVANENGFRCIHIFEKDVPYLDKFLGFLLPLKHKYRGYQYSISYENCSNFLEEHHRQGGKGYGYMARSKKTGEPIACMTFKKSRNKSKGEYELYRLCYPPQTKVYGFAEKAFEQFILDAWPESVVSYCDLTYNVCTVYEHLGFKYSHTSKPNYKWVKGDEWRSRENCQRHKLAKIFGKAYDSPKRGGNCTMTEKEIMEKEGYVKVYDCGNKVFIWKNK